MSENTKIEWATHTFNPWEGCQKVGPGCDNCYAENRNARFAGGAAVNWGPGAPRRRTSEKNWQLPLKWEREAVATGVRPRVFCSSLADVFDNEVDPQWRQDLFDLILATPHIDWLLLTKRIGNAGRMLSDVAMARGALLTANDQYQPPANVWLGATIVNQEEADRDIPKLLAVPAARRFLSMEPLLETVDISRFMWPVHPRWPGKYRSPADAIADGAEVTYHRQGLVGAWVKFVDWVIVGGESGPGARPMHPDWARTLRDQCVAAGVPFLFKQWGDHHPSHMHDDKAAGCTREPTALHITGAQEHRTIEAMEKIVTGRSKGWVGMCRLGKKAAGRHLDGRTWDEVPA